jgi:signal peptidase I
MFDVNSMGVNMEFILHVGNSMNPLLKSLDILCVIPYDNSKIQQGDVIVFFPPAGKHKITHRVISIREQYIKTQGDNNNDIDLWVLAPTDIIGRVIYLQRKNRRIYVAGGIKGHLLAIVIKKLNLIKLKIFSLLRPFYHWLIQSNILKQKWLLNSPRTRILVFNNPDGKSYQLVIGNNIIGKKLPAGQWKIRHPFKLFIDETSLSDIVNS